MVFLCPVLQTLIFRASCADFWRLRFSLAQAFMPGKAVANNVVVHALLGRNDLGGGFGPLKRADDYFIGALRTQA